MMNIYRATIDYHKKNNLGIQIIWDGHIKYTPKKIGYDQGIWFAIYSELHKRFYPFSFTLTSGFETSKYEELYKGIYNLYEYL